VNNVAEFTATDAGCGVTEAGTVGETDGAPPPNPQLLNKMLSGTNTPRITLYLVLIAGTPRKAQS